MRPKDEIEIITFLQEKKKKQSGRLSDGGEKNEASNETEEVQNESRVGAAPSFISVLTIHQPASPSFIRRIIELNCPVSTFCTLRHSSPCVRACSFNFAVSGFPPTQFEEVYSCQLASEASILLTSPYCQC